MNFVHTLLENTKISNLMKMCSGVAELLHANRWTDRQADMMKLIVAFCNFVNTPKNVENCTACYHVKLSE